MSLPHQHGYHHHQQQQNNFGDIFFPQKFEQQSFGFGNSAGNSPTFLPTKQELASNLSTFFPSDAPPGLDADTHELFSRLLQQQAGTLGSRNSRQTADAVVPASSSHPAAVPVPDISTFSGGDTSNFSTSSGGILNSPAMDNLSLHRQQHHRLRQQLLQQQQQQQQPQGGAQFGGNRFQMPQLPRPQENQAAIFAQQMPPQSLAQIAPPTNPFLQNISDASRGTVISPGALARKQRATEDTKRGKRRPRSLQDATSAGGSGSGQTAASGASGDAAGVQAQVVPVVGSTVTPVVKIKEERRKKRLLRNRVSAQQARERKRQATQEMEARCKALEVTNAELEARAEALMKENEDLRLFVKSNMRPPPSASSGGTPATTPTGALGGGHTAHLEALRQLAAANKAVAVGVMGGHQHNYGL